METTLEQFASESNSSRLRGTKSLDVTEYLILSLIFAVTLFVTRYHWNRRNLYKHAAKMNGPVALPVIGNGLLFAGVNTQDILEIVGDNIVKYSQPQKAVRAWLGNILAVLVSRPEDMEIVMNSPDALQKSHVYRFFHDVVGEGLFSNEDVNKWKQNRKFIITTMNPKVLRTYVDVYGNQADIFAKKLETQIGKGEFDVFHYAYALTMDIISETILGYSLNHQQGNTELAHWLDTIMNVFYTRIFKPWLHPDFIFMRTSAAKESYQFVRNVRKFAGDIVAKKRAEFRAKKGQYFDDGNKIETTLDILVKLSEEENIFNDKQIVDELLTIIIAGSDSSANIDSFTLMMLGMHPKLQEQVYQEQRDIFGDSERLPVFEDLKHMKLLERVIKETLRLFPIGPILARESTADIDMKSYTIPKGSLIALCIRQMHISPDVWEDPFKFDPDRFLPENFAKMHPYSFVPFSGGPRNCLGPQFAMMSMKTVLSTVIRRFKFHCSIKRVEDIPVKADVMIRAVNGNFISLERRT